MKTNMSNADRIIRSVLAVALVALSITGTVTGALAVVLYVLGGIFLLTGIFGWCPLYALLKIRTNKVKI